MNTLNRIMLFIFLLTASTDSPARQPASESNSLYDCLLRAAYRHGADPFLIWAVKLQESGARLDHNEQTDHRAAPERIGLTRHHADQFRVG